MAWLLGYPTTTRAHDESLRNPAFCEELRVRDIVDDTAITTAGAFVAAYELDGIQSQYHDDDARNRTKEAFEAVLRALPERSVRLHVRFEVREDTGSAIDAYRQANCNEHPVLGGIDEMRCGQWRDKEAKGEFFDYRLHVMLHWDPVVHHAKPGSEWEGKLRDRWSLSAKRCVERTRHEHEKLLGQFNSMLAGVEAALGATRMTFRRLDDNSLFLLVKQSLGPVSADSRAYHRTTATGRYESVRTQITNVSIEGETDDYLKVSGLLYSFVSLKDPPDATYPGILRELLALDFPIVVNTEIVIPDQAKVINQYKWQQRKMMAAQRDINGGFRVNVEAQVAERQLVQVLEDVMSSSLKTCRLSLIVSVRTSQSVRTTRDLEAAERMLADRRERVLNTITRMNGARGMVETLAQKRMFVGSVPAHAEENKREIDVLTLNAADLMPVEAPWRGTPRSPGILLETRQRKLIPFSPFDPDFTDANMLIMASSGGGKTFMAQIVGDHEKTRFFERAPVDQESGGS